MGDDCLIGVFDINGLNKNGWIERMNVLREHNGPIFTSVVYNRHDRPILFTAGLEGVIKGWDIE